MPLTCHLPELPTGLLQTWDLASEGKLAKHDAANLELAEIPTAAAGQFAPKVRTGRGRIARKLCQRRKILFLLELTTHVGVLQHQCFAPLLFCHPGFSCHSFFQLSNQLIGLRVFPYHGTETRTASTVRGPDRDSLPSSPS